MKEMVAGTGQGRWSRACREEGWPLGAGNGRSARGRCLTGDRGEGELVARDEATPGHGRRKKCGDGHWLENAAMAAGSGLASGCWFRRSSGRVTGRNLAGNYAWRR
ncbi:hypothetical protein MRB53_023641 [Persea americana]|uniref:Uncharacterized protein n=1 Tax=Persea americana TaxID=3435 RepID=A0ACC2LAY7_PERAE|nr:hypothetical protein MRB53_023641 [Persea americana]